MTNRVQYFAIDSGRVADFVTLDNLPTRIDLTQGLLGSDANDVGYSEPNQIASTWNTNRLEDSINISAPTEGIINQLQISMGNILLDDSQWAGFNGIQSIAGPSKERAIATFRKFMGLTPFPPYQALPNPTNLAMTVPFAPARKFYHRFALQANDPLVHFRLSDLQTGLSAENSFLILPPTNPLPLSNLKRLNERCRPFPQLSFNRYFATDDTGNPAFQDAKIGWSQDWNFPNGIDFNLQWLDQIHRGTPWQTLNTGSAPIASPDWASWAGSPDTNPTNDWKILEMLLSERTSLGTPSSADSPVFVNNTLAKNTGNGGAISFAAGATLLNNLVSQNSSGLLRLPVTNEVVLQTNCVFNNAQYDYANLSGNLENFAVNPQFVAAGNANFHLLGTSPGIDAGSDTAFAWLINEPARVQGAGLDLGAFELSANDAPVFVSPSISNNDFVFKVTGFSGESYVIERSVDLVSWVPISTNTMENGFSLVSDSVSDDSNHFYRAIHQP